MCITTIQCCKLTKKASPETSIKNRAKWTQSILLLPRSPVSVTVWELWFWLKSVTFLISTHLLLMQICRQSGQLSWSGTYSHMEKRGSRYLPYARYSATKYVCLWGPTFGAYLAQIRAVGKRYNVVLSRAAKKLLRLICTIEKFGQSYNSVAYKFSGCLNVWLALLHSFSERLQLCQSTFLYLTSK